MREFFERYVAAFNRSLQGELDAEGLMDSFADHFVSASPQGVMPGANGETFREMLEKAYGFYKQIGTERMVLRDLEVTRIDPLHHLVKVHYTAQYRKPASIDFDVSYLLQTLPDEDPKIFAFVAGDEMARLKKEGLL